MSSKKNRKSRSWLSAITNWKAFRRGNSSRPWKYTSSDNIKTHNERQFTDMDKIIYRSNIQTTVVPSTDLVDSDMEMIANFDSRPPLTVYGWNGVSETRGRNYLDDRVLNASTHLYHALLKQSSCCAKGHIARLQLGPPAMHELESGSRSLELFISSEVGLRDSACRWQAASCEFGIPKSNGELLSASDLCQLLQDCELHGDHLHVVLQTTRNQDPSVCKSTSTRASGSASPETCLGTLLDRGHLVVDVARSVEMCEPNTFTSLEKATLCLNLSIALLHLSSDTWLHEGWSVDEIFLTIGLGTSSQSQEDLKYPFLSTPIVTVSTDQRDTTAATEKAKSLMLSLARMLMEIHIGKRIVTRATVDAEVYTAVRNIIHGAGNGNLPHHLRTAIEACLEGYRWDRVPEKEWVHTHIVQRLQGFLGVYSPPVDRRIEYEQRMSANENTNDTPSPHNDVHNALPRTGMLFSGHHRGHGVSSASWFSRLDSLNSILDPVDIGDSYTPVKVAVLDTGFDENDADSEYITEYKDFVDSTGSNAKIDTTGHGTSLVNLIIRVCSSADIIVGRVWETSAETKETQGLMAEAIGWALDLNADIICLSSGFQSHPISELKAALHRVQSSQKLLFAAASNDSYISSIAYPARDSESAMCIFSTDAGGKNSREMNPAGMRESPNFAIFGEGVTAIPGKSLRGSSYSTAIASGLAARVLDFSRHSDTVEEMNKLPVDLSDLPRKRGMTEVFRLMSTKDQGYRCITPWSILPSREKGLLPFKDDYRPSKADKKRIRLAILGSISRCLDDI